MPVYISQKNRFIKLVVFIAFTLALCALALTPDPALAYAKTGHTWSSSSRNVLILSSVTGTYKTQLTSSIADYNAIRDVKMSVTSIANNPWKASLVRNSSVNWEGITYTKWNASGKLTSAICQLNRHYCDSYTAARKKVVWLHELGHGWGLGHVASTKRVMYKSASAAYKAGVHALTSDEINGINALY